MDTEIRDRFVTQWQHYCPGAELPITFEIGEGSPTSRNSKNSWRLALHHL